MTCSVRKSRQFGSSRRIATARAALHETLFIPGWVDIMPLRREKIGKKKNAETLLQELLQYEFYGSMGTSVRISYRCHKAKLIWEWRPSDSHSPGSTNQPRFDCRTSRVQAPQYIFYDTTDDSLIGRSVTSFCDRVVSHSPTSTEPSPASAHGSR